MTLIGAVGGAAMGLTSVGRETLVTVLLVACGQVEVAQLVGTDILDVAVLTGVAALAHAGLGT